MSTYAGDGTPGRRDGVGRLAQFRSPRGLAIDAAGNIFVADHDNNLIRIIRPDGIVTRHSVAPLMLWF